MVDKIGIGPTNARSNASSSAKRLYLAQFLESAIKWRGVFTNPDSAAYIEEVSAMEEFLEMVFNASSDIKGWNVFELSKWSTNVGFAVKFSVHVETSRNFSIQQLAIILEDAMKTGVIGSTMYKIYLWELDSDSDWIASQESTASATLALGLTTAVSPILTILPESITELSTFTIADSLPVLTTPQMSSSELTLHGRTTISNASPVSISAAPASIRISGRSVHSIHIPESDGTTTKRPSSVKTFSVSMKIGRYKYDQEMANPRSEIFQKTAYEIESALRNIFRKQLSNFVAVRVFKLEQGSVIVSYNVHLASSSKQKSSDVQNIITTNAENGELQHLKVSGVVVTQVEDDKSSDSGSTSTFIYILCGVGGLLAIGIIVLVFSKVKLGNRFGCCFLKVKGNIILKAR